MAVQRSSYSQSGYRDRVRGDMGLRGNSLLTDAEVNSWGQEAQKIVARETHWLQKNGTGINVVAGTQEYDFPTDAIAILEVTHDGDHLRLASMRDLKRNDREWRDVSGRPTHYYLRGMTAIGLYPNPSASITGGLVPLYAYLPAAPANDADFYYVPTVLDWVLVAYGKMMAALKDATGEGRDRIAYYRGEWDRGLREMKALVGEVAVGELTVFGADNDIDEEDGWEDPLWVNGVP